MGSTEEALITKVHGHGARGDPSERPFDRKTGVGRLSEKPGDYSDAASRGHKTVLLTTEITGAMGRALLPGIVVSCKDKRHMQVPT